MQQLEKNEEWAGGLFDKTRARKKIYMEISDCENEMTMKKLKQQLVAFSCCISLFAFQNQADPALVGGPLSHQQDASGTKK